MKKGVLKAGFLIFGALVLFATYALSANVIYNVEPNECAIEIKKIIDIKEGTSYDIVFSDNYGDHYYINRGLERGLNLDSLNAKVLNKTVTLHLPKLWLGTSEHIAQIVIEDDIIFTEFN